MTRHLNSICCAAVLIGHGFASIVAGQASSPSETVAENAKPARRPNVVFVLVDDLGWKDVGCYGSSFYETPNVDRLADKGVRFVNGYASCPVCSPTRASVMTGKYPARLGLTAHIGDAKPEHWKRNTRLVPASYTDHLPLEQTTVAETFRAAGYATFHAGKWHLGSKDKYWPEYQGFDINIGGWAQGGPFGGKQYFSPYGNPRIKDGPDGEHLPDRLATDTVRFIESHRHKPFFAMLSFYSVHVPLVAREDLRKKYARKRNPFGETATPIYRMDGKTRVREIQEHSIYGAMVEAMDEAVGKVMTSLEELHLMDDTIVVFTSDNGGLSTGDMGISRDQGWPTSNAPLRCGKGWLYDGGIRVPLIIKPQADIPAERTSNAVASSIDFLPTLAEMAGITLEDTESIDGVSLAQTFQRPIPDPLTDRSVFWHYPHYGNQGGGPGGAIRKGDWKLIEWYETRDTELYNLKDDLGEVEDLSDQHRDIHDELYKELVAWRTSHKVQMPSRNSSFLDEPKSTSENESVYTSAQSVSE